MHSGLRWLSLFLLLPVLTILVHNAVPHHHHVNPVEICCDNEGGNEPESVQVTCVPPVSPCQHDACSFNPEFTLDLQKILFTAPGSSNFQIASPVQWVEPNFQPGPDQVILSFADTSPNLLRGPPEFS